MVTSMIGAQVGASHGPDGGCIYDLAIDPATPTTLYAGTEQGVFKSTDNGANWSAVNTSLIDANTNVRVLAIDPMTPATLYAGTEDDMFKSTNGGKDWRVVSFAQGVPSVYDLALDPATPTTLYVGSAYGMLKSTNGGENWSAVTGLTDSFVFALVLDPVTSTTLYAGTAGAYSKARTAARTGARSNPAWPMPLFMPWRLIRRCRLPSMRGQR